MTPAEEDALYEAFDRDRHAVIGTRGAFLVSIRAAVAQERERAAKWHEARAEDLQKDKLDYMVNDMRECLATCLKMIDAHLMCAAAIRRGEE